MTSTFMPYPRFIKGCLLNGILFSAVLTGVAYAEPTVTVTDPITGQPVLQNSTTATPNADNQANANNQVNANAAPVADAARLNGSGLINTDGSVNTTVIDPNSLAAQLQPSDNKLDAANQKLLSQNAELQRQVNDLQTQVNVLVYESKGQLFLYGALTVVAGILVGIFIGWLVFIKRQRW